MNFKRIARNLEYLANFEMKSFSDEKYISKEVNKYIRFFETTKIVFGDRYSNSKIDILTFLKNCNNNVMDNSLVLSKKITKINNDLKSLKILLNQIKKYYNCSKKKVFLEFSEILEYECYYSAGNYYRALKLLKNKWNNVADKRFLSTLIYLHGISRPNIETFLENQYSGVELPCSGFQGTPIKPIFLGPVGFVVEGDITLASNADLGSNSWTKIKIKNGFYERFSEGYKDFIIDESNFFTPRGANYNSKKIFGNRKYNEFLIKNWHIKYIIYDIYSHEKNINAFDGREFYLLKNINDDLKYSKINKTKINSEEDFINYLRKISKKYNIPLKDNFLRDL